MTWTDGVLTKTQLSGSINSQNNPNKNLIIKKNHSFLQEASIQLTFTAAKNPIEEKHIKHMSRFYLFSKYKHEDRDTKIAAEEGEKRVPLEDGGFLWGKGWGF